MQLQMTTPMDLGLERQDGLDDNEEDFMFDLNEVEGYGDKRKRVRLQGNEADLSSDEDDDDEDSPDLGSEDEDLDTEDEEEAKLRNLEDNLDQLYDQYQNHKLEKDAKHKAKEARKKRDAAEGGAEWGGIKDKRGKGSGDEEGLGEDDDDSSDDDDDVADTMAYMDDDENAVPVDELGSSDDEEEANDDDDQGSDVENRAPASKKRTRDGNLVQDLKAPKKPLEATAKSRAAAMWFDQPVFKDIEGLDEIMKAEAPASKKAKEVTSTEQEVSTRGRSCRKILN